MARWRFADCGTGLYAGVYRAYVEGSGAVAGFFTHRPDLDGLRARARELDSGWRGGRAEVAAALADYQRRIGGNVEAARRLAAPEALAVVTGQQAGVLTGPLLTIYKAVTALRWAAHCEESLGRPVVPVFWVASEDHDFAEVATTWVVDATGELVRLDLPALPGAGRRSVGFIPVPEAVAESLTERLLALVPHADPQIRAALRSSWQPGQSLADWFARQMAALFGPHGLVVLDPMLPALRQVAAPLGRTAWERAGEVEAALAAGSRRLVEAGLPVAIPVEPGHTHIFVQVDGERQLLLRRDGRAVTRRGQEIEPAAVEAERLSYGVALRPVVEAHLLPVLAHVSGPGEVAYQAQIGGVFEALGVSPPVILPRLGLTVGEAEEGRVVPDPRSLLALRTGSAAFADHLLAARAPFDIAARFDAERQAVRERYAALQQDLVRIAPALAALVEANHGRVEHQVDYLEAKARQHLRRRHRLVTQAVAAARNRFFPRDRLQEQMINVWPSLLRHGPAWLGALIGEAPLVSGHFLARWEPD